MFLSIVVNDGYKTTIPRLTFQFSRSSSGIGLARGRRMSRVWTLLWPQLSQLPLNPAMVTGLGESCGPEAPLTVGFEVNYVRFWLSGSTRCNTTLDCKDA
jgi:hypothetical protein